MKTSVFAIASGLTLATYANTATAKAMTLINPVTDKLTADTGGLIEQNVVSAIGFIDSVTKKLSMPDVAAMYADVSAGQMAKIVNTLIEQGFIVEATSSVLALAEGEYDFTSFHSKIVDNAADVTTWFEDGQQMLANLSVRNPSGHQQISAQVSELQCRIADIVGDLAIMNMITQSLNSGLVSSETKQHENV